MKLEKTGDWIVRSDFYTGSNKILHCIWSYLIVDENTQQRKIIDQSKKIQLGRIILIRYSLVSQVKVDHLARIIIDSCTLEHSDFQGTTFNLVTDGEAVESSENNVIRFRLDQVRCA